MVFGQKLENLPDVITDASWHPQSDDVLVTGCGGGMLKIYSNGNLRLDLTLAAHSAEIACIQWISNQNILSSSWDRAFKIWDLKII